MLKKQKPIKIAGKIIKPGQRKLIGLPTPSLYNQNPLEIPIHVIHAKKPGPCVYITAAIHGDEINGVEIARLLINNGNLKLLHGTLIVIPVTNIYGFMTLSRYLPDRRDLNRSFPGSKTGSQTARLAHLLVKEIIQHCTHGIDLHTGNINIDNLPHIRANLDIPGTLEMANAFDIPVILDNKHPDGSMRQIAKEFNIPIIVFEAGEALRFNELAIQSGLRGVLNILHYLHMVKLPLVKIKKHKKKTNIAQYSGWIRAPQSGIIHSLKFLGTQVKKGDKLGIIADPFSKIETDIFSPVSGIIIGKSTLPLINEGDALFHIAKVKGGDEVTAEFAKLETSLIENPFTLL